MVDNQSAKVQHFSQILLLGVVFFANSKPKSEKSDEMFGTYRFSSYICKYNPNG